MKNIHILPTDKPSRLYLHSDNELQLRTNIIRTSEDYLGSNQHIYITSNEEIKYDEYYLGEDNHIYCLVTTVNYNGKKIILTTDPTLSPDVHKIPDEFLEWFVKNPSCEEVEVELVALNEYGSEISVNSYGFEKFGYKIIIPKETYMFLPKEEPKQLTDLEIAIKLEEIEREEVRAVNRTDLYNSILSIVKQIPRENVESDAMDAQSCAYEIEQLFYKWQKYNNHYNRIFP